MAFWNRGSSLSPIGLQFHRQGAVLMQLQGEPGQQEIAATARITWPEGNRKETATQDRYAELLAAGIRDHAFRGHRVITSLSVADLIIQTIRVGDLPPREMQHAALMEAEDRIGFSIADAEVRFLHAGQIQQDGATRHELVIIACRRETIDWRLNIIERAGLAPIAVDIDPCAAVRAAQAAHHVESGRHAYLTLEPNAISVALTNGRQIIFVKHLSITPQRFDEAVASQMNLSLEEARRMRGIVFAASQLDEQDEIHRAVATAIRIPLDQLKREVELCLQYHKVNFRAAAIENLYLAGQESTPWMADFLQGRMGLPCHLVQPLAALRDAPRSGSVARDPAQWLTPLGLCLKPTPHLAG